MSIASWLWPSSQLLAPIDIAPHAVPHQEIRIHFPGDTKNFNCSLVEYNGKLLLASRLGWAGSRLFLSELDTDFQPIITRQLHVTKVVIPDGVEDPRLFIFDGRLHIAFIAFYKHMIPFTKQMLAWIDDDWNIRDACVPDFRNCAMWEKNWGFFEWDQELYSIYTVRPHTILWCSDGIAEKFSETMCPFHWKGHHLRGGAPPVRVGEEYYHFFHTMMKVDKRHEYTMGVYTFAARPPFEILRWSSMPLLTANADEPFNHKRVVFPCGAIRKDGKWIISYGWQDKECRIAIFDESVVEGMLTQ